MSCHDHIDALIDIARDPICLAEARDDAGEQRRNDAARAALAHAGTCDACAQRLDRERALTTGLREMAIATPEPDARAMEARLLRVFVALHTTDAPPVVQRVRGTPWWLLASAAVLLLAVSATWYFIATRQTAAAPRTTELVAAPSAPVPLAADVRPSPPAPVFTVAAPPPRRPHHPDAVVEEARLFSVFIALPDASALPDFESGHIVRIDVPVSMLSAYGRAAYGLPADGVEVSPAAPAAIEADVLVGQDGIPRAIRLASSLSNNQE